MRLDWRTWCRICIFLFFFLIDMCISHGRVCQWVPCIVYRTHHLFDHPNFHWNDTVQWSVYCSRNSQTCNFFIKNRFHSTIYTFKNYVTIMFSVFSKINGIQTDPQFLLGAVEVLDTYVINSRLR